MTEPKPRTKKLGPLVLPDNCVDETDAAVAAGEIVTIVGAQHWRRAA